MGSWKWLEEVNLFKLKDGILEDWNLEVVSGGEQPSPTGEVSFLTIANRKPQQFACMN